MTLIRLAIGAGVGLLIAGGALAAILSAPPRYCADRFDLPDRPQTMPYVDGVIDAHFLARLQAIVETDDHEWVAITSAGGDEYIAIEAGRLLHEHGISAHIVDYCLSACMNYILPSAANAVIGPDAVYGYHGGGYGLYAAGLVDSDWVRRRDGYRLIEASEALYRDIGADIAILELSVAMLDIPDEARGEPPFRGRYSVWIPGPEILAQHDICPSGDFIRNEDDVRSRLQRGGYSDEPWVFR